jgi:hypothetical protein
MTKTNPEVKLPPPGGMAPISDPTVIQTQSAPMSPLELMARAITAGASVEVIERLSVLAERWQQTQDEREERWRKEEARVAFIQDLIAAKREFMPILKGEKADFATEKGRTRYEYETMDAINEAVDMALSRHNLATNYEIDQTETDIITTCVLMHGLGHMQRTTLRSPLDKTGSKNYNQSQGSALTYQQKYTKKAILGIAAAKDDDAQSVGKVNGEAKKITPEDLEQLKIIIDAKDEKTEAWVLENISILANRKIEKLEDIPEELAKRSLSSVSKRKNKK